MKRQSAKEIERETAKKSLLEILKPGDVVHCILRHVSRSGMQREISFFTEGMRNIDYLAAKILDMRIGKRSGLVVRGCGMDMGFHIVSNLGYALFPDGFECTGRDEHPTEAMRNINMCPSNDHSNGDRNYEPHTHNSGGYALRSRWI